MTMQLVRTSSLRGEGDGVSTITVTLHLSIHNRSIMALDLNSASTCTPPYGYLSPFNTLVSNFVKHFVFFLLTDGSVIMLLHGTRDWSYTYPYLDTSCRRECVCTCRYETIVACCRGDNLNLCKGGLQLSKYKFSHSYHLMVSTDLEELGGHLFVVTDVLLDLLKLLLLKGTGCCLGECNAFQLC